jgi:hypothetical protein
MADRINPGEPPCCAEYGCRRRQPIEIQKAGLSGIWYVITRYKRDGTRIEAQEKHQLHPLVGAALDVARNHWDEVLELHERREAQLAEHRARMAAKSHG